MLDDVIVSNIFPFVANPIEFACVCKQFAAMYKQLTRTFDSVMIFSCKESTMDLLLHSSMYKMHLKKIQFFQASNALLLLHFAAQLQHLQVKIDAPPENVHFANLKELVLGQVTVEQVMGGGAILAWVKAAPQLCMLKISIWNRRGNNDTSKVEKSPDYYELVQRLKHVRLDLSVHTEDVFEELVPFVSTYSTSSSDNAQYAMGHAANLTSLSVMSDISCVIPVTLKNLTALSINSITFQSETFQCEFFSSIPTAVKSLTIDTCAMYDFPNFQHLNKLNSLSLLHCTFSGNSTCNWLNNLPLTDVYMDFELSNCSLNSVGKSAKEILLYNVPHTLFDIFSAHRVSISISTCPKVDITHAQLMPKLKSILCSSTTPFLLFHLAPALRSWSMFDMPVDVPNTILQCCHLLSICLINCQLTQVPEAITKIPTLTSLNMSRNLITNVDCLFDGTCKCSSLSMLVLHSNPLTSIPSAVPFPVMTYLQLSPPAIAQDVSQYDLDPAILPLLGNYFKDKSIPKLVYVIPNTCTATSIANTTYWCYEQKEQIGSRYTYLNLNAKRNRVMHYSISFAQDKK